MSGTIPCRALSFLPSPARRMRSRMLMRVAMLPVGRKGAPATIGAVRRLPVAEHVGAEAPGVRRLPVAEHVGAEAPGVRRLPVAEHVGAEAPGVRRLAAGAGVAVRL